jgi:regulator of nucleoside diphosphate kinase
MRRDKRIVLTRPDLERLRGILGSRNGSPRDREHFLDLREEIDRARIVGAEEVTPDVVTLQSEVRVRDSETGIPSDYTVVSPAHADVRSGHVSVLAPLGTALLGYREGDEVEWQMPGGVRRLQIERVRQPQRIAVPREHEASAHSAHVAA